MTDYPWIQEFPGALTVCDTQGVVLEMNEKAIEVNGNKIGANLLEDGGCHPEPARTKLAHLMETHQPNVYTIEKFDEKKRKQVKKLIFQSPWYRDGKYSGFVELSLEIPFEMAHALRPSIEVLTFSELTTQGWFLDTVLAEAARLESAQFGSGAYTAAQFAEMHASPGGLCALLFPAHAIEPGRAWGVMAGRERRARDGTVAHQLVTIAIDPGKTGQGLGPRFDAQYEPLVLARGYRFRVLRSRAPASIYLKYGRREGGSPHGEATRFALKRGFHPMNAEESHNFFGDDIARLITDNVPLGENTVLRDCVFAESHSTGERPPWYFICMSKVCR